ncbi:hypothetical protein PsAD2_00097 [Pseudovibrio axinellae]|uniref:Uncharacterized protein n=1 Tax=Pseudovibrio axinellae TaxID=989403 RepID=A0A166BAL7_9HYPH|nr:hypothetical protein [Pseudovibrio axinellae]KZL22072.1 hypothetical protein PsAD2_00097 [Pseudovibrio axinellae]SEQ56355.1 hypothetical protein SAMN05421798_103102 [Pseudovibrio axinellae]
MDTTFGRNGFSGQPAAPNKRVHETVPFRFLSNNYLIGLGLALQKKNFNEYLTGSGNTVQRKIGTQVQRVTLQYTNKSFYFSSISNGAIVVFDYLSQDEKLAQINSFAHVGKQFAMIKKQQISELHEIAKKTRAASAIDLLLDDYPGSLTMLHPVKIHRWIGKDRIDWYARQGGRHYRIKTSNAGAALKQWSDDKVLLRLNKGQVRLHEHILQTRGVAQG